MDHQLKQRLVGAAVIFSLAVIFLPMLLDGSGNRGRMLKNEIPSAPVIDSYALVEERIIELNQEVETLRSLEPLIVDEISDPPASDEKPGKSPVVALESAESKAEENPAQEKKRPVKVAVSTLSDTVPAPEVKVAPVSEKPSQKSPQKKSPQKQSGGQSWVVQMGSFSDRSKAYELRDRLKRSGYSSVFIEKYKHDRGLNYRVRLGPFITKKSATIVKNKIAAKYNLKGIEMRYEK